MRHLRPVLVAILAVLTLSGISEARWYDPESGRFLSEDPIWFEGGDTNLYVYTKNNPINLTDPTGLNPLIVAAGSCLIDPPCAGAVMIFLAGTWKVICKNPPPIIKSDPNDNYCKAIWITDTQWCDNNCRGRDNLACHQRALDDYYRCLGGEPRLGRLLCR